MTRQTYSQCKWQVWALHQFHISSPGPFQWCPFWRQAGWLQTPLWWWSCQWLSGKAGKSPVWWQLMMTNQRLLFWPRRPEVFKKWSYSLFSNSMCSLNHFEREWNWNWPLMRWELWLFFLINSTNIRTVGSLEKNCRELEFEPRSSFLVQIQLCLTEPFYSVDAIFKMFFLC